MSNEACCSLIPAVITDDRLWIHSCHYAVISEDASGLIQNKLNKFCEPALPFSLSLQAPMGVTKSLLQPEPSAVSTATEGGCQDLCRALSR